MAKKFLVMGIILVSLLVMSEGTKAVFSGTSKIKNNSISTAEEFPSYEETPLQFEHVDTQNFTEDQPPVSYSAE